MPTDLAAIRERDAKLGWGTSLEPRLTQTQVDRHVLLALLTSENVARALLTIPELPDVYVNWHRAWPEELATALLAALSKDGEK